MIDINHLIKVTNYPGHNEERCELAKAYLNGVGVPQDIDRAITLLQGANRGNHPEAAYLLGKCHEKGIGVDPDIEVAESFYRKAAKLKNPQAIRIMHDKPFFMKVDHVSSKSFGLVANGEIAKGFITVGEHVNLFGPTTGYREFNIEVKGIILSGKMVEKGVFGDKVGLVFEKNQARKLLIEDISILGQRKTHEDLTSSDVTPSDKSTDLRNHPSPEPKIVFPKILDRPVQEPNDYVEFPHPQSLNIPIDVIKEKIFISYSRKDKSLVFALRDNIESLLGAGSCWIDLNGIESDSQFEDVIISAINRTEILIFMYSPNSARSEWTRKELKFAQAKGKKIVFVNLGRYELDDWYLFNFSGHDVIDITDADQKEKLLRNLIQWCV